MPLYSDGVRGVANTELTGELAFRLGKAGAYVLTKEKKNARWVSFSLSEIFFKALIILPRQVHPAARAVPLPH